MKRYVLKPEVAGGFGEGTELEKEAWPPKVTKLHYAFDGWMGDALLESFPCYIVTHQLQLELERAGITGAQFASVEVSRSQNFVDSYPELSLPQFFWLKICAQTDDDDFWLTSDFRLVVSDRALEILKRAGIAHADVALYKS